MHEEVIFEFRNRDFPLPDLFEVHENPEQSVLNHDCYVVFNGKCKYYHSKNNNLMPTRYDFVLVPKYDAWEDKPEQLNMVLFEQTMEFLELILNYAMEKHKNSSPWASSLKEIDTVLHLILPVSVSLLDPEKIDSVHLANMYRKYAQDFH